MNGLSLKQHFCMFEISQVKHNSLDCHNVFEYFPFSFKFTCSKLDTNQKKKKKHVQSIQTLIM
jgi:hypothetical protein